MRGWIVVVTLCASPGCDRASARPAGGPAWVPGIESGTSTGGSTGEAMRLDLGVQEPLPDLPGEDSSSGSGGSSTGEGDSSSSSSTGEAPGGSSSSTGEGGSTGGSSTSGGPPAVCGDGVCEASERSPCWATPKEAWCFIDCYQVPECESDCPCTPEAAAVKNFCAADPAPACAATAPGGYCELGDDVQGFYAWHAKCG